MPAVDVAMARSLQGGVWGTLRSAVVRSVAADLARRGIIDDAQNSANDVAKAFSSWDNCMNAAYCKWPVIAVIIIGGLIIFSVIWCIIRCCCCGLSCCCSCFECLKCCGNCCGCCDPPGGKKTKNLDDPYAAPAPQLGYRTEAPMQASPSPFAPQTNHAGPPQYAQFEMQKPRNDDALPEMPSWESSSNKKVMVEQESVELSDIKKSPHSDQQQNGVVSVSSPGQTNAVGARDPYDQTRNNQGGYLSGNQAPDHYSPIDQGYGYNSNNNSNNSGMNGYGMDQSYAAGAMGAAAVGARQPSPAQNYNGYGQDSYGQAAAIARQPSPAQNYGGYGQDSYGQAAAGARQPSPVHSYNGYGQDSYGQAAAGARQPSPVQNYGSYGQDSYGQNAPQELPSNDYGNNVGYRGHSPGAPSYGSNMRARQTPAPAPQQTQSQELYGDSQPSRLTPAPPNDYAYGQSNLDRAFSPAPDRQYGVASPHPQTRPVPQRHYGEEPPQSPINNNSGFDFNSGYSRPHQSPGGEAYPGYKPYQP